jgi:hypothetical protein
MKMGVVSSPSSFPCRANHFFSVPISVCYFFIPGIKKRRMKIMFEINSISDTSLMHRKLFDGQKQAAP